MDKFSHIMFQESYDVGTHNYITFLDITMKYLGHFWEHKDTNSAIPQQKSKDQ